MPHVLYNHITHSWDRPEADDGYREIHAPEEAPEFGARARLVLSRLALITATAFAGFILWGMIAGLLLETAQR